MSEQNFDMGALVESDDEQAPPTQDVLKKETEGDSE